MERAFEKHGINLDSIGWNEKLKSSFHRGMVFYILNAHHKTYY